MRLAHLSLFHARAAIQAEVDVSVVVEELLQHVQHARHLGEDQHPVAPGLQLPQQSVERLQLTCAQRQVKTTHAFNNDSDSYVLARIFLFKAKFTWSFSFKGASYHSRTG